MEPLRFPANKMSLRSRVFQIIKDRSFERGTFVLASGATSDYYLDLKPTTFDPEGSSLLAKLILQRLAEVDVDLVGGLELGAVPIVSTLAMVSFVEGRPIPAFVVRKRVKDHGTMNKIETSEPLDGKKVVILDDVTTKGGSAMEAVEAAKAAGAKIVLVLSVVDREEGATETYQRANVPFDSLFTASEFLQS